MCFSNFDLLDVNAIYTQGQLPDHQGDTSRPDEVSFKGNLPGYVPAMSSAIKKPVEMSTSYLRYQRIIKIVSVLVKN